MTRNPIIAVVVLLLVAGVVIGMRQFGEAAGGAGRDGSGAGPGGPGGSKSNPGGKVGASVTPAEALKRLRGLPDLPFAEAPDFETVERLVEKLSTADLEDLIREIGFENHEGLSGWQRCALFAEWGRRDADAAIGYLQDFPRANERADYAIQQAWFSLIRGLAERDAFRALDLRGKFAEWEVGEYAERNGTAAIFKELARQDPAAAWASLLEPIDSLAVPAMLEGFFRGLQSSEEAGQYLSEWNDQRWDTEEEEKAFAEYNRQLQSMLSGAVAIPSGETIATAAAAAWANRDLDAALEWLESHGPGGERARSWRAVSVLRDWAKGNPEQALQLLSDERYAERVGMLGHGIIEGDSSLAAEVVSRIEDHSARSTALLTSVTSGGSHHVNDFFPAPGQPNRLPDFEGRYEALLEAVRTGEFRERQEQALLRALHREYRHRVPAAQEAVDRENR